MNNMSYLNYLKVFGTELNNLNRDFVNKFSSKFLWREVELHQVKYLII